MEAAAAELPASLKLSRLMLAIVALYGPQVRPATAHVQMRVVALTNAGVCAFCSWRLRMWRRCAAPRRRLAPS
jgi:hypothetical protein